MGVKKCKNNNNTPISRWPLRRCISLSEFVVESGDGCKKV